MENNKEKRGIYNVTFNNKNATPVKTDLELVEDAIIEHIAMYVRGYNRERINDNSEKKVTGKGAKHIKIHLDKMSEGEITLEELLNLGKSLREYTKIFKSPYIDNRNAKIYEWQNSKGIRFRAVIAEIGGGTNPHTHTNSSNQIISFYSDRNLKLYKGYDRMQFKNPVVENYYKNEKIVSQEKIENKAVKPNNKAKSNDFERGM